MTDSGRLTGSCASTEPEVVSSLRASIRSAAGTEIDSMQDAYLALSRVPPGAQMRALEWLLARFGWEHRQGTEAAQAIAKVARKIARQKRIARPQSGEK